MATETAAPARKIAPTDPTQNLWQLPALLLGIAAFVCAWQGWLPLNRSDPASNYARDMAALKAAYEKVTPDPVELKSLLNKVAAGVESYPEHSAQARFLLGSGYVRLAEITTIHDEAIGYWILAHQHFQLVTDKQLRSLGDAPKLAYRYAKTRAAVGLPVDAPAEDIQLMMNVLAAPQSGEEAGETHRLIADLAMRLTPPDTARAKIALAQYITTGIGTPPASLSRARLRLGELYLHSHEYEQARKWLGDVGPDAPLDVYAPAKALLAQVLMSDVNPNWQEAAKELETLRRLPGLPPNYRIGAAYQLAICKEKLRDRTGAALLFEEAVKGDGPEAFAASIQLADLYLTGPDPSRRKIAVDLLAAAFQDIRDPAGYDSSYIPLNTAQGVFELAISQMVAAGEFETAMKAARCYTSIAASGRDREKRAEVLGAWAEAIKAKGGDAGVKFKEAADEFAALAAYQPRTEGKLEMLRRSASYSRQAQDHDTAAKRLEEALRLPEIPEQSLPAVWVELADSLVAAGRTDDVFKIFNKIMAESRSPLSTATRYRLARVFVDSGHMGLMQSGRALFEQIARQQEVAPAEREYHERSLTELANALIREGNFTDAEARLRTQLGLYPNGPEAPLAKLLLGVALLQRAADRAVQPADAAKMHAEALVNFKQIVAACDAAERSKKLNDREAWLRLQAGLRVLQTYQQMRTKSAARDLLYDAAPMLERYKGTVDELIILSLVFHAFKQLEENGKALDTRERMREVFDNLPNTAFTQKSGEYSREYWQQVWFTPEKK